MALGDQAPGSIPDRALFVDPLSVDQLGAEQDAHGARCGKRADIDRELERRHPPGELDVKRGRRERVRRVDQRHRVERLAVGEREPAAQFTPAVRASAGEAGRPRLQPDLGLLQDGHPGSAGELGGEPLAVLVSGAVRARCAAIPVRRRVRIEFTSGHQRLDARPVFLAHPGADLAGRTSGAKDLRLDTHRAGGGRVQEMGAGREHMTVRADRSGGAAQHRQQVAAVGLAADRPLGIGRSVEQPRAAGDERAHFREPGPLPHSAKTSGRPANPGAARQSTDNSKKRAAATVQFKPAAYDPQMVPRVMAISRSRILPELTRRPSCSYSLVIQGRRPLMARAVGMESSLGTYMSS